MSAWTKLNFSIAELLMLFVTALLVYFCGGEGTFKSSNLSWEVYNINNIASYTLITKLLTIPQLWGKRDCTVIEWSLYVILMTDEASPWESCSSLMIYYMADHELQVGRIIISSGILYSRLGIFFVCTCVPHHSDECKHWNDYDLTPSQW